MNETIEKAGSEVAEEVIETAVEHLDERYLKYLGAFGAGAVVGIIAYKKVLAPAWFWMRTRRKPKKTVVKKAEMPADEDVDETEDEDVEE